MSLSGGVGKNSGARVVVPVSTARATPPGFSKVSVDLTVQGFSDEVTSAACVLVVILVVLQCTFTLGEAVASVGVLDAAAVCAAAATVVLLPSPTVAFVCDELLTLHFGCCWWLWVTSACDVEVFDRSARRAVRPWEQGHIYVVF